MEKQSSAVTMLDMFPYPVFLVKDGRIVNTNHYAKQRQIETGTAVADLIPTAAEEYAAFTEGYLSLNLRIADSECLASILRTEDGDLFHLQSDYSRPEFRTMSLIAQQLRQPLNDIMAAADSLFPQEEIRNDETKRQQAAQINKGLFQLLREVSNLSATSAFSGRAYVTETRNIISVIDQVLLKCQDLAETAKRQLHYSSIDENIFSLVDTEMLERSLYNLVSNAIKFSPEGSVITAKVSRFGTKIRFTIENTNDSTSQAKVGDLFFRFLREPEIEDGRQGLGLGIALVQHTASAHGGTLLLDHPAEDTIRFTMSIAIRQNTAATVRTPMISIDYLGGRDQSLVELSEVLPPSAYESVN